MYIQCITDILYRLKEDYNTDDKHVNIKKYYYEINNLVEYTNECFENVSKSYNCKVWIIKKFYLN